MAFGLIIYLKGFEECEWVSTGHLSEAISLRGLTN